MNDTVTYVTPPIELSRTILSALGRIAHRGEPRYQFVEVEIDRSGLTYFATDQYSMIAVRESVYDGNDPLTLCVPSWIARRAKSGVQIRAEARPLGVNWRRTLASMWGGAVEQQCLSVDPVLVGRVLRTWRKCGGSTYWSERMLASGLLLAGVLFGSDDLSMVAIVMGRSDAPEALVELPSWSVAEAKS